MPIDLPILLGAVIAAAFLANALMERTRFPDAVTLIGIGILFGRVFRIELSASPPSSMSNFSGVALAIVLFRTGLELDFKRIPRQVGRAILMAVFSFAFALFLVYCALAIGLELHGLTAWSIAAALACTSTNIALPVLTKLRASPTVSSLVAIESAISEALAAILVLALLGLGETDGVAAAEFWKWRGISFLVGGGIALVVGFLWLGLQCLIARKGYFYLLTIGSVFLQMSIVERVGGSGVFAVLVFGMILANGESILGVIAPRLGDRLRSSSENAVSCSAITESHGQIYFFIRGFFLLYLGILVRWPGSDLRIWLSIAVAAFAIIVGREIAIKLARWTTVIPSTVRSLLRISTPRGATTAILITILIPQVGSGSWLTVAIATVLISNARMAIGLAMLNRGLPAIQLAE